MNSTLHQMQKLYGLFVRVASSLQSPFLAIVRLYWGWQIAQNGWGKLHNLARVTEFFASLVGSSRVDLQACKLEYSIVSPK